VVSFGSFVCVENNYQ